jgi:hypothetical protein
MPAESMLGVPVVAQKEFQSRALIMGVGGDSVVRLMQCLHKNCAPLEREELTVDDSVPASPTLFFDVRIPGVRVPTEYGPFALRLTVIAVDGVENRWFDRVARRTPEFVIVADESADPPARVVERVLQRLQSGSDRRFHLLLVTANSAVSDAAPPATQFVSVSRVESLDDPKCIDVITAVAEDIVKEAASRTTP